MPIIGEINAHCPEHASIFLLRKSLQLDFRDDEDEELARDETDEDDNETENARSNVLLTHDARSVRVPLTANVDLNLDAIGISDVVKLVRWDTLFLLLLAKANVL